MDDHPRFGRAMSGSRTLRAAERSVVMTRDAVSRLLTLLQLRIRALEVSRDPEVKAWIRQTRERVASGGLARMIADQPDDPRSLLVKPGSGSP
jgi:hypothetical protein